MSLWLLEFVLLIKTLVIYPIKGQSGTENLIYKYFLSKDAPGAIASAFWLAKELATECLKPLLKKLKTFYMKPDMANKCFYQSFHRTENFRKVKSLFLKKTSFVSFMDELSLSPRFNYFATWYADTRSLGHGVIRLESKKKCIRIAFSMCFGEIRRIIQPNPRLCTTCYFLVP